jgi:mevalonate kinase
MNRIKSVEEKDGHKRMMEMHSGTGTSSGKIILIGEHSVVYGQPAIAMPLPAVSVTTCVSFRRGPILLKCAFYEGELIRGSDHVAGLKRMIPRILERLNQPAEDLLITVSSNIPAERGMGSSAAVSISVVRSLYDYFDCPVDRQTLLALVNLSEQCYHGAPSGLDAEAASSFHPLYFVRGKGTEPIHAGIHSALVIADTGIKGQTGKAIAALKDRLEQDRALEADFDQLGRLAESARRALQTDQPEILGRDMFEAHLLLKELGVSHPALDRLVDVAMTNGALGAKMTGGGCGGCMIALIRDRGQGVMLAAGLRQAGASGTWIQPLDDQPVYTE